MHKLKKLSEIHIQSQENKWEIQPRTEDSKTVVLSDGFGWFYDPRIRIRTFILDSDLTPEVEKLQDKLPDNAYGY